MKRSHLHLALFASIVCLTGCNALLGNDESTNSNGDEGKVSLNGSDDTSSTSKDAGKKTTEQTGNDSGTSTATRDDSKAPCTACSSTLVAKGADRAHAIQVDATHVYFSDSLGVHRIGKTAAPCSASECLEHLWSESSYSGFEVANDSIKGQICWLGQQVYGCTDTKTLATKKVSLDSIDVGGSLTGLQVTGGTAYAIYDANRRNLGSAPASDLASGVAKFGNTVTTKELLDGFAVNATHIAWEQSDNSPRKYHILVRARGGGPVVEITLPDEANEDYTRNLALWNDHVYFSRNHAVYVAPIDGSADAVPLATFTRPGKLAVSALGVIAAAGGDNANSDNGVEWSPLLPEPAGKALRVATRLASSNEVVPSVAVSDDAVYYSVTPISGESGAGVWKIPIE